MAETDRSVSGQTLGVGWEVADSTLGAEPSDVDRIFGVAMGAVTVGYGHT